MSSSEFFHVVQSFTVQRDKLEEFYAAVEPVITMLEKTDPHVWHIYAIHREARDGLDHVVLVEKFFNEEAYERVHGSPPFVEMTKKIIPLLNEPPQLKRGRFVLGFQDRQR